MRKIAEYFCLILIACGISVGITMGVLYGSYDKALENKVQEIIDSEPQENSTDPGKINIQNFSNDIKEETRIGTMLILVILE